MFDGRKKPLFNTLLPKDLIIDIFQAYLPRQHSLEVFSDIEDGISIDQTPGQPPALLLAAVCREWRRVALSTPQLWNIISFDLDEDHFTHDPSHREKVAVILQEWLDRAGQAPLYLRLAYHLDYSEADRNGELVSLRPIFNRLQPHLSKFRVLDIQVLPGLFEWLTPRLRGSFDQLESLAIRPSDFNSPQPSKFNHFPFSGPDLRNLKLTRLLVWNIDFLKVHVNYEQLTFFNGSFLQQNECLHVLQHATQLKSCRFSRVCPIDNPSLTNSAAMSYFTAISLRTLDFSPWTFKHHRFTAPELVELTSGCSDIESDQKRSLLQFLSLSASKLTKFTVQDVDDETLMQLLDLTPNLQILEILMPGRSNGNLFRRLAEDIKSESGSTTFLPRLENLSWLGEMDFSWSLVISALPTPRPDHIPRRPLSSLHFSVELVAGDDESYEPKMVYVDKESLQTFIALARNGFKLVVEDCSELWANILLVSCKKHGISDHPFILEYWQEEWNSDASEGEEEGSNDEDQGDSDEENKGTAGDEVESDNEEESEE